MSELCVDLCLALDPTSSELQRQVLSAVGQADDVAHLLLAEESGSPPPPCQDVLHYCVSVDGQAIHPMWAWSR